jgi:hypothetical protein
MIERIVDRGGEGGRGRGLVGARLEPDAEVAEHVVGIGKHVDEVRDRRALIAGDVGHAGLQQRLGDGEDAFAAEFLSSAEPELCNLAFERPFRHALVPMRPLVRRSAIDSNPRHRDYI